MIEKLRTLDDIPTNTQLEKNILTLCSTYTNKTNVPYSRIWGCCNGKQKTAYGYNWKYRQKDVK